MSTKLEYLNGRIVLTTTDHSRENVAEGYEYYSLVQRYPGAEDLVFEKRKLDLKHTEKLRPYQVDGMEEWVRNGMRGVVVLPTAAGKTHIAIEAISRVSEPALVVVPTLELLSQWKVKLERIFGIEVGQIGGGANDLKDVTVSTFDSAYLKAKEVGNRFRLLVVDEVHHLAASKFRDIARYYASPYRLGLTATYERPDRMQESLIEMFGGKIFEMNYDELKEYLSDFEIIRVPVELDSDEELEYERNRAVFLKYLRSHRMKLRGPWDFQRFILSSWSNEGRTALMAWRRSRAIALNPRVKIDALRYILSINRNDKTLIFTDDTSTAYTISREFLIPAITYLTPLDERKRYLEMFRNGTLNGLVSSRVLDEGVDVPDASLGIIVSGSGSSRQFRQRLGRVLRPAPGKKARMYEIVSSGTTEYRSSNRRRKGVPNSAGISEEE